MGTCAPVPAVTMRKGSEGLPPGETPKGPFAQGNGTDDVFVVQGDHAVRRRVRFGLAGYDFYEVVDGLSPGEVVILSDMKDYEHLDRIKIK